MIETNRALDLIQRKGKMKSFAMKLVEKKEKVTPGVLMRLTTLELVSVLKALKRAY